MPLGTVGGLEETKQNSEKLLESAYHRYPGKVGNGTNQPHVEFGILVE